MEDKYFEVTMSGLGGKGVLTLGRILAELLPDGVRGCTSVSRRRWPR